MADKRYSLDDLKTLVLPNEHVTVPDRETGETKTVKTVSRAEIAAIVAYMLGIDDEHLEEYYSHHYAQLLKKLQADKDATIIRYLCRIRNSLMNNFLVVDNEIRYNLSNLDRMQYFDKSEIDQLAKWGVYVVQANCRSDKYMMIVTELLDAHINACNKLFPDSVKFVYIRNLFVPPHYKKNGVLKDEYNKYRVNKLLYPFQAYMYWKPVSCGYILYSDSKLLETIYGQNGEQFVEACKYRDASDDTKENIYKFIHESSSVVMVVDCENCDPYKLYGVLKNLDPEDMKLVQKVILFDDYHTTIAWDYIGKMIQIPVDHVEVPRVTDAKSLVDIHMAVGVASAYYKDDVDSFILCSSDSDFWGLISSLPEARFLVLYEYSKCGKAIKDALDSRGIFHCAMDDFYMENAGDLQKIVLKKVLEKYLPNVVGEDGWELTRQIYSDAYITAGEKEMRRFYEKYIKTLRLKIGEDGKFYVAMNEWE